jgi:C-terminal processing protease CtpA/Prc
MLEIGTAEWLTRNGKSVWRVGVVPDIKVAMPDRAEPITPADFRRGGDSGLQSSGDAQLLEALSLLATSAP